MNVNKFVIVHHVIHHVTKQTAKLTGRSVTDDRGVRLEPELGGVKTDNKELCLPSAVPL